MARKDLDESEMGELAGLTSGQIVPEWLSRESARLLMQEL